MSRLDLQQVDSVASPAPIRQLSCLEALRERRGDVRCFTPALLVTHAHLPVDPAQEFIARFPAAPTLQPFCVELPASAPPFFSGIPATVLNNRLIDWNRRLYAIAAERAKECFDFLAGIGVSGGGQFFASSVMYEATIPDPLSLAAIKSTLDVTIFGVLSSDKIAYLAPAFNRPPAFRLIAAALGRKTDLNIQLDPYIENEFKQLRGDE